MVDTMLFESEVEQLTEPAVEPLTLQDVKTHVAELTDEFNTLLLSLISAAREYCEIETNAVFAERTFRGYFNGFPDEMWIHINPFVSVQSVAYTDENGILQVLDPLQYNVFPSEYTGLIVPAYGVTWPNIRPVRRAVQVDFTAGYSVVPHPVRVAMLLYIAEQFENRKDSVVGATVSTVPIGVKANLAPYVRHTF